MFSVVIPLYNKELSIQNTIQSVLKQTYQEFEIIVIDDGSTDNSATQVREIPDSRIRLVRQKNQGVSAARNKGIQEAKYEWIALLDGDDLWKPNHLEEILLMMKTFPDAKCFTTSFIFSDLRNNFQHKRTENIFKVESYFEEALSENIIWTSTFVIYKDSFKRIGGFNPHITNGEDLDYWARVARELDIIKSLTITAIYNIDAENRTSLNRNVEKTHVFHFNLGQSLSEEERYYYEIQIINRMIAYTRAGMLHNVFKLKRKHKYISWLKYFSELATISKKKLFNTKYYYQ